MASESNERPPVTDASSNAYEFSVSELAMSLKRMVEDRFGHVRVRGELGRVTIAKSGHCYLDIKDDKAVINSIIWKGTMNRLAMRPEEGMDVIVEGRMSTYPGRSNYQLIIEKMELAGEGALMALFEKRKKMFAAEGLFDTERKRDLPFMPAVIGVVTSPTGAVIRDILHRIMDRYPVHVLVWPVLVQGDKAADQISAAITGFNHADGFPRPDVLIVARGGGSLEDLWCFNEENVVRAAAGSKIPIISAVGHETDWTLIDYVADYRAPTPTGAAEVAVPVREEWLDTVADYGLRLTRGLRRLMGEKRTHLNAARLPRLETVLSAPRQRLDLAAAKLPAPGRIFDPLRQKLALAAANMPKAEALLRRPQDQLTSLSARLRPDALLAGISRQEAQLSRTARPLELAMSRQLEIAETRLTRAGQLLDAYSYQGVLARGYALVSDDQGKVVRSSQSLNSGDKVKLTFADGDKAATIEGTAQLKSQPKPKKKQTKIPTSDQGDLF